mmetsp:Transcript_27440/g.76710  ORF Transcript_27440/g.76710 Transcript_27440/m.76710 type:complete len:165 (+) Transcript_27440:117-611(+)|eukprot:CAMPEP_0119132914 /NCGR_PEP_ID=MMETSP1310-20130426/12580_1 /TAXON_ID=464262 /ORGANISM="Genus nov. species nov., Strain RCC2339" /LENGTH=164 /DNA_ID=CAMNT_0007123581 /DNA_START=126 /DNA_END=620 /DNA_ORIENTATION=+
MYLARSLFTLRSSVGRPAWARAYSAEGGDALKFSLTMPHDALMHNREVKAVHIPAIDGELSILAGSVPTVTELNAGTVAVENDDGSTERYFVAPGFALKSDDGNLLVSVPEACKVEDLDPTSVESGLAKWQQEYDAASEDEKKAEALIGVEVHKAMKYAIDSSK